MAMIAFFVSVFLGMIFSPLWLISIASLAYIIHLTSKRRIPMDYDIDDEMTELISERMAPLIKIARSKKVWRLTESSKVLDKKYQAGASSVSKRSICRTAFKAPFPFKTSAQTVVFQHGTEKLVYLPDKLFIMKGAKIGALNYSDVKTSVDGQPFIEREAIPKDAKVIDYTWQYVNKDGSPDKRFKSKNKKLPICLYGKMRVEADKGVNTVIMFSNANIGVGEKKTN